MNKPVDVLGVVALTTDLPERGLVTGLVGTVVNHLGDVEFEIEFSDDACWSPTGAALRSIVRFRFD